MTSTIIVKHALLARLYARQAKNTEFIASNEIIYYRRLLAKTIFKKITCETSRCN